MEPNQFADRNVQVSPRMTTAMRVLFGVAISLGGCGCEDPPLVSQTATIRVIDKTEGGSVANGLLYWEFIGEFSGDTVSTFLTPTSDLSLFPNSRTDHDGIAAIPIEFGFVCEPWLFACCESINHNVEYTVVNRISLLRDTYARTLIDNGRDREMVDVSMNVGAISAGSRFEVTIISVSDPEAKGLMASRNR